MAEEEGARRTGDSEEAEMLQAPRQKPQSTESPSDEVQLPREEGQEGAAESTEITQAEERLGQIPQGGFPTESNISPGPLDTTDTAKEMLVETSDLPPEKEKELQASPKSVEKPKKSASKTQTAGRGRRMSAEILRRPSKEKDGFGSSEKLITSTGAPETTAHQQQTPPQIIVSREKDLSPGFDSSTEQESGETAGETSTETGTDERESSEAEALLGGVEEDLRPMRSESSASMERPGISPEAAAGLQGERPTSRGSIETSVAKTDMKVVQEKTPPDTKAGKSKEALSNKGVVEAARESVANEAQEDKAPSRVQSMVSSSIPALEVESVVYSAFPGMIFDDEQKTKPPVHPISLSWVFGYNCSLPVFNLLDDEFRVILYVCSHTVVIHDIFQNRQYHLQGHSSCISCICISEDRRWIATADQGPESLVIVWDGFSGVPVHTIFDSHPEGGVCAIAISHDSKFLATVGAAEVQKICIWKWTLPETKPLCSVEIQPQFGCQGYIAFNCRDHQELVSNSKTQVIFYKWDQSGILYHAPALTDKTFNKSVGVFSQTLFHFSSPQAITGTSEGKLVVWDVVCPPGKAAALCVKPYSMKAIKLVHLQKDGITVLATIDRHFVTCDVKGHIKFYDGDLQLVHWYSQFKLGPICCISFSKKPICPVNVSDFPTSCTLAGQPFIVRNFILSTTDAMVVHVTTEGVKVSKCLEEPKGPVHAVACHPSKWLVAKGSYCGLLKVWNYRRHKYLVSRIFKGGSIQSLCYNHDGSLLAAGFTNGSVSILDSISLEDECQEPFRYSTSSVLQLSFSHDSQYLASADDKFSVTLYKQVITNEDKIWVHLAALHSHYKPIRTILFGVHLDSDEPRLLTLGEDRLLVEYDLKNSVQDELVVIRRDRIEQSAVPKCIAWYPPVSTEHFFLTANDQYKMKLYNVTTKMSRKTLLGPTYGSPLEKILFLPQAEGHDPQKWYLAYITQDKVGLQILPIDGNPHKSLAFICHPAGVSDVVCSHDGCHLFTSGGNDFSVMKWDLNVNALEAAVFLGGEGLIPFYNLLDGGREGEFFRELEDYFYYAQLCHQGINTMEPRKVSTHIPLEQIPFVMRAMGFYPSEQQIEDMLNEVKFSEYLETGKQVNEINLGDFIRLYVNYRPAFGLPIKEIQTAFEVLGYQNQETVIGRDNLLLLLQQKGEHLTEEELAEYLTTLLGMNPEGGRSEFGIYDPTGADDLIENELPEEITVAQFAADILGLPLPGLPEAAKEPMSSDLAAKS